MVLDWLVLDFMINRYAKGRRLEHKLVNEARGKGLTAGRTAGSKTIFDIWIIDFKKKKIKFLQVKDKKIYGKEKKELEGLRKHSGNYDVEFDVWSK